MYDQTISILPVHPDEITSKKDKADQKVFASFQNKAKLCMSEWTAFEMNQFALNFSWLQGRLVYSSVWDKPVKRKKFREYHNHKSQPIPGTKKKMKETQAITRKTNNAWKAHRQAPSSPSKVIAILY